MAAPTADALLFEAIARHQQGRTAEARPLYRRLLALAPGHADGLRLLGVLERRAGGAAPGDTLLRRAVAVAPLGLEAPLALAALRQEDPGRAEAALPVLRHVLALAPDHPVALAETARLSAALGRAGAAETAWGRLGRLRPEEAAVHAAHGCALRDLGRGDAALARLRRAIALEPDAAPHAFHAALIDQDRRRFAAAAAGFRRALRLDPDLGPAAVNLGNMLFAAGRTGEAEAVYRAAIARDPGAAATHATLGMRLLAAGRLQEGWRAYDRRPLERDPAGRRWRGEALSGRSVLVWGEQGVGDLVMFASCLPDLMARAGGVTLDVAPRLRRLFARSFPGATVLDNGMEAPACDAQTPIGSLPRWLRPAPAAFPDRRRYLVPDAARVAACRARLPAGPGPVVGLSWRSTGAADRSVPLPALVRALAAALPTARLVSLQYGDHGHELLALRAATGVSVWRDAEVDPLGDIDDAAAQIAALDLVVSIDTTAAHLAGGLGVPAWVLLPVPAEWRWFLGRADSPWYPSVRLFRQRTPGDWDPVLAALVAAGAGAPGRR